MFSVIVQRRRWCEQDQADVSVASSMSSGRRRQRKPDVRTNLTVEQTDDWQQNEDDVLKQSQRLGCSVSQDTEGLYRPDSDAWTYCACINVVETKDCPYYKTG